MRGEREWGAPRPKGAGFAEARRLGNGAVTVLKTGQASFPGAPAFPQRAGAVGDVFVLNDGRTPSEVRVAWPHGPRFHGQDSRKPRASLLLKCEGGGGGGVGVGVL